jgi:YVTN family beta-propeller protein
VTNLNSDTVSQYDVGTAGALTAKATPTVAAGAVPFGVAVSPDGQSVYVTNQASFNVSQYDVGTGGALAAKATPTVPAGAFPVGVAASPDGQSVYVTNQSSDTVSQYDVGTAGALTAKAIPTVPAGDGPVGIAVRPTPPPTISFGGFLAPIDNPPTVNTGKAGRTYPVKFQLTDANGAFVTDLAAVSSIKHPPVTCGSFSGDPTDALETTATGTTGLRYDTDTNQYIYNWKTPNQAGCYELFVTLADGGVHSANFSLK